MALALGKKGDYGSMKINRVCVYCASSRKVDPIYFEAAERLGEIFANNNITTVYGGGAVGLMGCLADSVLKHNGEVIGVIPEFMKEVEWDHKKVTQLITVQDMHERKKKLIEDVDAIIALPGGCGTLEELVEVITHKRLGIFLKPIIIVNINNFYDHLIAQFKTMVEQNFMGTHHKNIWQVAETVDEVLEKIKRAPVWSSDARSSALI